jgi:hypothetical protein
MPPLNERDLLLLLLHPAPHHPPTPSVVEATCGFLHPAQSQQALLPTSLLLVGVLEGLHEHDGD